MLCYKQTISNASGVAGDTCTWNDLSVTLYHQVRICKQQSFLSMMEASLVLERSFILLVLLQYLTERITSSL